jgi:hypothetical protein
MVKTKGQSEAVIGDGQTTQWQNKGAIRSRNRRRADNTMVKTKGQSEAVIEEGQTTQWSKQRGNQKSQ